MSPPEEAGALEGLADTCAGTGLYEARLGYLYSLVGRTQEGERLLRAALETTTGFERELKTSLVNVLSAQARFDDAEDVALNLIADYPEWPGGFTALAGVLLVIGDYQGVVAAAEKSNAIAEDADTYLFLTMAHFNMRNYEESARAMQTSLRLDRAGLMHTDAVASGAMSLLAMGHHEAGLELLERHIELVPDAAESANFQLAARRFQLSAPE